MAGLLPLAGAFLVGVTAKRVARWVRTQTGLPRPVWATTKIPVSNDGEHPHPRVLEWNNPRRLR